MKNSTFLLIICFFSGLAFANSYAQQTTTLRGFEITWYSNTQKTPSTQPLLPPVSFAGAAYDFQRHNLPYWCAKFPVGNAAAVQAQVVNAQYEPLGIDNLPHINELQGSYIAVETKVGYEKKQSFALLSFIPIRINPLTGQPEKLVRFDLTLKLTPGATNPLVKSNRTYTDNSVLNQGVFYQLKTDKTGIHKIDYSFLQSLGINTAVSLTNLRIFGNGGGMLPELAGAEKYDDITENPIQVYDQNGNNLFDAPDYILFYAESPDKWTYNASAQRFTHQKHLYSNFNYYFLNFDIGPGKRIAPQPQTAEYNTTVTAFTDYAVHNNDRVQPIKSGRTWLGEEFNVELTQNFNFSFPNLVTTEPLSLRTQVAARYVTGSASGTSSTFRVSANGAILQNIGVSSVTGSYEGYYARTGSATGSFTSALPDITLSLNYVRPDISAIGWLDFLELNARRQLVFTGPQMSFADPQSVGVNKLSRFVLQSETPAVQVWEVTAPDQVTQWQLTPETGNQYVFYAPTTTLRRFIAFDGSQYFAPIAVGTVQPQNLHALQNPDMIIVTHPDFLSAAERLANYRRTNNGLEVTVVTPQQIYNEFSSGTPDISAIRDFVKMFYDRAGSNIDQMPQHLLLLGDASYDYRNIEYNAGNNQNFVPTYESMESFNATDSYCSDDYFGVLDDTEGADMNQKNQFLDVGIGRLPVTTTEEAEQVVDKILSYYSSASLGEWRNNLTFIADDEDSNIHLGDAETHTNALEAAYPAYNIDKIYLDAYQQVSTAGGNLYPDVNTAINNKIFSGTLVMNYVGHGGEAGWAHERILKIDDIQSWTNTDKLPLFITATCSFSRYDNPEKVSAGELLMVKPNGGAIALMTTVRLVYASANEKLNTAFLNRLFETENGQPLALGEVARLSKNDADLLTSSVNNRKFVLLGDPSLQLNYPKYRAAVTAVNNQPLAANADTIKALAQVTVAGQIQLPDGSPYTSFNGTIYPVVYDKSVTVQTLANDPNSPPASFQLRRNIVFKGKATVTSGQFSFTFITPKDIAYQYGSGRISLYADDGVNTDAQGYTEEVIIGGVDETAPQDNNGPDVQIFMNDEKFVFGGTTNANPTLLVKLADQSGVNTVGNGIGHDISAILNDDTKNSIMLNQYYKAALDSFQKGEVRYPLANLPDGQHTIEVKAWDTHNNSGKGYTEFVVAPSASLALSHVLNYPNPFTTNTAFWFEHNRPNDQLLVTVQIFTISGRVVKTIQQPVSATGFRVDDIFWDGRDDFGNKIGRGTYVYKLTVRSLTDNSVAHEMQKLVLLR
ncbi:oxidoreductase [Sphingobacteriales bacterium UPWRP_1]|nr:hypothetical protein B6N25_01090 [Sphingobacteriales bacterium TSM_CSS]PSJ72570.1 oxidoreductase [Sphingobacteriales bacterium UPWRP_1]